jgi:phosphatidylglycerophosphatase C
MPARVAVFDLDGTLSRRDTLVPYLCGHLRRNPARALGLANMPWALAAFVAGGCDRGLLKQRLIKAVMQGETRARVDAWTLQYVADLHRRGAFRPAALAQLEAHRRAGDVLILLSASPDLYVPSIGRSLSFSVTLCTEIKWQGATLDGQLITANRRGEEKRRCIETLRQQYPGAEFTAYGNSSSDIPHLRDVEHGWLVNGSIAAKRAASRAGLGVADWS